MFAHTTKITSLRLTQISTHLSNQFSRRGSTMATLHTKQKLNTGAEIRTLPSDVSHQYSRHQLIRVTAAIGFGTWQDAAAQEDAVTEALKAGYRHIDTARIYGTEPAVGAAIKKSGVPRSEIFITTKLWNNSHHPDDVEPALDASLKDLETDYLDLYLMHWPSPFAPGDTLIPKKNGKIQTGDTDYVDTCELSFLTHNRPPIISRGPEDHSRLLSQAFRLLHPPKEKPLTSLSPKQGKPWRRPSKAAKQKQSASPTSAKPSSHASSTKPPSSPPPIKSNATPGSNSPHSPPSTKPKTSTYNNTPPSATPTPSTRRART